LGGHAGFNYHIVDAADGRPLYISGMSALGVMGKFHHAQLMNVNKQIKKAK
jgi:hypothetical protein